MLLVLVYDAGVSTCCDHNVGPARPVGRRNQYVMLPHIVTVPLLGQINGPPWTLVPRIPMPLDRERRRRIGNRLKPPSDGRSSGQSRTDAQLSFVPSGLRRRPSVHLARDYPDSIHNPPSSPALA